MVQLKNPARAPEWDALTDPYGDAFPGDFAPDEGRATAAQEAAISGAASKMLQLFFCYDRAKQPVWCAKYDEEMANATATIDRSKRSYPMAFQQGEDIATMVGCTSV